MPRRAPASASAPDTQQPLCYPVCCACTSKRARICSDVLRGELEPERTDLTTETRLLLELERTECRMSVFHVLLSAAGSITTSESLGRAKRVCLLCFLYLSPFILQAQKKSDFHFQHLAKLRKTFSKFKRGEKMAAAAKPDCTFIVFFSICDSTIKRVKDLWP